MERKKLGKGWKELARMEKEKTVKALRQSPMFRNAVKAFYILYTYINVSSNPTDKLHGLSTGERGGQATGPFLATQW